MNLRNPTSRRGRTPALASVLLLLLVLPSCGDDSGRPKRHPATGRVLVDGEGAAGIKVRLHPIDRLHDIDALSPSGLTDADGAYRLGTYEDEDGAPPGRYKATLFWSDTPPGPGRPDDLFSGAYARPESSGFEVTIVEGQNTIADIEATRSAAPARPRPSPHRNPASGAGPDPDGPSTP